MKKVKKRIIFRIKLRMCKMSIETEKGYLVLRVIVLWMTKDFTFSIRSTSFVVCKLVFIYINFCSSVINK